MNLLDFKALIYCIGSVGGYLSGLMHASTMVVLLKYVAIVLLSVLSVYFFSQNQGQRNVSKINLRPRIQSTITANTNLLYAHDLEMVSNRILATDDHAENDHTADDHGADDHGAGHPSLFQALPAIHVEIGTYSVLIIIGFIIILKQLIEAMYAFTHESAFHGMVKKIEEELMIVGSSSFIFKVVLNTTRFGENMWAYPLEFGEVLVPLIAFSYCGIGIFLVVVSLQQCYTWSRANNLKAMEILDEYFTESKTWRFRLSWKPMNKSIEQMEFRIFRNIFCSAFKIKKDAFSFDEYVAKVFQRSVLSLIEIRLLDWFYVTVLLFLNLIRVKLDLHTNTCTEGDEECDSKRTVRLFTIIGAVIFGVTFLLVVLSRRLELAIMHKNGVQSHSDYAQLIKSEEERERASAGEERMDLDQLKVAAAKTKEQTHHRESVAVVAVSAAAAASAASSRLSHAVRRGVSTRFLPTVILSPKHDRKDSAGSNKVTPFDDATTRPAVSVVQQSSESDQGPARGELSIAELPSRGPSDLCSPSALAGTPLEVLEDLDDLSDASSDHHHEADPALPRSPSSASKDCDLRFAEEIEAGEAAIANATAGQQKGGHSSRAASLRDMTFGEHAKETMDVFWCGKPELYFEAVQVLFMVLAFYAALWLTVMASSIRSSVWKFLSVLPAIVILGFFFYIVKTAALLRAVCEVDTDSMLEVIEETEAARQLSSEIRDRVLQRLDSATQDPLEEIQRLYNEIDTNRSDSLSRREFGLFMELMGISFSAKKWERIYKEIDRNYDNEISLNEFLLFMYPDHDAALSQENTRLKAISQRVTDRTSNLLSHLSPITELLATATTGTSAGFDRRSTIRKQTSPAARRNSLIDKRYGVFVHSVRMEDGKKLSKMDLPQAKWTDISGDKTTQRTQYLGHDSHEYRKAVHIPPVNRDVQNRHNIFIHELGADVLKARLDEEKQMEMEREALRKKQTKVTKLLRRKIKVTDLEDGGVSITMDQEWDTSTWNDELIQAGCEALILIFYDSSGSSSDERKERAVQMLQKLLYRHTCAELYVRKNIEMMIGKAANKLIRGGKCGGLLDLLYILHSCKETFMTEMSQANFNGRAIDMLIQEAKLAAILIQHAFRANRNAKRLNKGMTALTKHMGFGSEEDIVKSRVGVISGRTKELRAKWRAMHCFHPPHIAAQIGGLRGPIHVGSTYTKLALEIILQLVGEASGKLAQGNREDVVRAHGCILLTTFLASPSGQFCRLAAAILAELSNVSDSFLPIITSGCLGSAVKCMQYLRSVLDVGKEGLVANKHEKVSAQGGYELCLDLLTRTAVHAAGMYRACLGYRYITPAHGAVEKIDYSAVLRHLEASVGYSKARVMDEVKAYLGHPRLLKELSAMIARTEVSELLTRALRCFFTILCSEAHDRAVTEITALQGVLMVRIGQLVHHNNVEVGSLALCICLQICCEQRSRQALVRVQVDKLLSDRERFYTSAGMMYDHPAVQRNCAFTAALCRQFNWRYLDPNVAHSVVLGLLPFSYDQCSHPTPQPQQQTRVTVNPDAVRLHVYLDLLRTMRTSELVTDDRAEQLNLADWVILPNEEKLCLGMSKAAALYGAKALVDFICHPTDSNYYESQPLDQSAASCVLLEGLAADIDTAFLSFSTGAMGFLAKYIYLCKFLFLGKRMLNSQILVILNGVKSAVVALGRYALACKRDVTVVEQYVTVVRDTELIASVLFFMNTLSISHPKLERSTRAMQKVVGIGCLKFLGMYADLMVATQPLSKAVVLADLYSPAQAVVTLIKYLKTVHKRSEAVVEIFALACAFLCQVTATAEASTIALQEWKIFDSLRIYLPTPLSGILPLEEAEISSFLHTSSLDSAESAAAMEHARRKAHIEEYKVGLLQLPVSFFILCTNLCQISEGLAQCFTEGYLRRTLDRLSVLNSKFIKHCARYARNKHSEEWLGVSEDLCGCLGLVSRSANYHHPKHGSSNDLILHELYQFIPACKNIICWQLHTSYARTDAVLLSSYEALAAVAKDAYRINKLFQKFDIYNIIRHELARLNTFPESGAKSAVQAIDYSCHGLTSKYLVDIIPLLREPLAKVNRMYPRLSGIVRDCNWTLTRAAKLYKETVDITYTPDEHIDEAMEEFIRSGNKFAHSRASFLIMRSSSAMGSMLMPEGASPGKQSLFSAIKHVQDMNAAHAFSPVAGTIPNSPTYSSKSQPAHQYQYQHYQAEDSAGDVEANPPGTYMRCGVSNCGSLLLPADASHHHGASAALSPAERATLVLQLPVQDSSDPTKCAVSKLSARGAGLQNRLAEVKSKAGFRELARLSPDPYSLDPSRSVSAAASPSSSQLLKPFSPQKGGKLGKLDQSSFRSYNSSSAQSLLNSPLKGAKKSNSGTASSSAVNLRSLNSPALSEKPEKIRQVLLTDLPELILTRPK